MMDVQTFITEFAEYMRNRDAFTAAYALVCNPARKYDLMSIIEETTDKMHPRPSILEFAHFAKPIVTHEWCAVEDIYLPQSKDDLDKLISNLDLYGAKMTGRVCAMPGCEEPASNVYDMAGRKYGICQKHDDEMNAMPGMRIEGLEK